MKRILLIALVTLISFNGAIAQSMSDSQIISFIQKEQKKGTSQSQIVTKLMQKGVSVTRLQKLRRTYQGMGKSSMGDRIYSIWRSGEWLNYINGRRESGLRSMHLVSL